MSDNTTSRRDFMNLMAGATLAAAAKSALSADGLEPVKVAVIGSGARGSDLIRSLTTVQGADLVAVCDDYPQHLAKGGEYAGPKAQLFDDYRKMLDRVKPQAVVIAVPITLHYPVALDVLAAGCDVFCEKTMTYTIDEGRKLAKAVDESKQVFQVGIQRRANPIYQQAAAMVQAGVLGQIAAVKCQWHRHNNWRRPIPVPKSDPQWATLERRLNWRLYKDTSGGLMTELGSHQLDVANWLLGTTPTRVIASGGIDYWRDGRDVDDNVFCIYDYHVTPKTAPRGAVGERHTVRVTYSSLCNNAYEGASELIMGTRGTLYLFSEKGLLYWEPNANDGGWVKSGKTSERSTANASVLTAGKTLKLSNSPWAARGEPVELDNMGGDDTRDELVSFLDHVRRRDVKTIADVHEGLRNAATVLIANQAIRTGQAVDFPTDL